MTLHMLQETTLILDGILDILLNVFLAIAVDNLADADALGDGDAKETQEQGVAYNVN
jgi:hypothetical protein